MFQVRPIPSIISLEDVIILNSLRRKRILLLVRRGLILDHLIGVTRFVNASACYQLVSRINNTAASLRINGTVECHGWWRMLVIKTLRWGIHYYFYTLIIIYS